MLDQIDIQDIVIIAKDAGQAIMEIYIQDFAVEFKTDNSPLTIADRKANEIIVSALSQLPVNTLLKQSIPILSEEGRNVPYDERKNWDYFWLIDPLDGTKEFVKRNGEFTINIALIHKKTPVLGVVYSPVLNVCYWAKSNEGAFKDGKKLPLKTKEQRDVYKIVASRSHMSSETKDFIEAIDTEKEKLLYQLKFSGSANSICRVIKDAYTINLSNDLRSFSTIGQSEEPIDVKKSTSPLINLSPTILSLFTT